MKRKLVLTLSIIVFAYLFGLLTLKYQLFPYFLLKTIYDRVRNEFVSSLDLYFIDEISEYDKLKFSPIETHEQLAARIDELMVNTDSFEHAYDRIEIVSSSVENHILTLHFNYMDSQMTAWAYYKPALTKNRENIGINIIPGSGLNQSSAMFYNKKTITKITLMILLRIMVTYSFW